MAASRPHRCALDLRPSRSSEKAARHFGGGALAFCLLLSGIAAPATAQDAIKDGDAHPSSVKRTHPAPETRPHAGAGEATTRRIADAERLRALGLVPGRPVVRPVRVEAPPEIDGRLDDDVWSRAAHVTGFVQQRPLDGAPATEETDVWVAYDRDHLYLAFHAHYQDPSIMRANRVDRDRAFSDDLITVYLDTFLDQQRAYDFDVNAYGVQGDGIVDGNRGAIPRADRSWDALFETGGRIVDDGFTAEMAIPFKSLRYPERDEEESHTWGLQIVREIKGKDEENAVWAPMSRDESSFFAQMGLLEGMTDLSKSRNLEVMPTFTAIRPGSLDEESLRFVDGDTDPDLGVNVKYGVTSNLTADFTLNPDFSQIESDRPQIEVNQRFPVFYDEQRPFFLEGAEIFDLSGSINYVHTRTIVEPDYGAKLTGKVGRTTLGVLVANDRAPGRVDDPADPAAGQTARTVIGRAKYDVYSESHVGGLLTSRDFLDGHSRLGLVDGTFRLGRTAEIILRAAGSANAEPGGPEETGHVAYMNFRRSGRNLSGWVAAWQVSPDFGTDVGFIRRTDERRVMANARYRFWPQSWIINWGPEVRVGRNWDFGGQLQDENVQLGMELNFARNVDLNVDVERDMERFRGIDFEKQKVSLRGRVGSSRTISFGGRLGMGDEIYYGSDPFLGEGLEWRLNTTLRPIPRLTSRLDLDASRLTDPRNGDEEVFDVKILRARSTFQFTDRLSLRNITEYNTFDETVDLNLLFTYRVNAGTVFFAGYDDHYRQASLIEGDPDGDGIDERLFFEDESLRRTNRALFMKMQYLFRM